MKIYIIRHAEAVPLGTNGIHRDDDRYLTEYGVATAAKLAEFVLAQRVVFDAIVSSRLVRAVQTAAPLKPSQTDPTRGLVFCDRLAPETHKPRKVAQFLAELPGDQIAVVGHQPDLGELLAWLLDKKDRGFDLEKGTIVCVDCTAIDKGKGNIDWLVPPSVYERA